MASIGISDVVTASAYSEKTHVKKLMKMIIIKSPGGRMRKNPTEEDECSCGSGTAKVS